jgi:hypothetical protein
VKNLARRPLSRIRTFYATNLPVGDFLGEVFYAVWMVVVSLGILGGTGFEGGAIAYVVLIAFIGEELWEKFGGDPPHWTGEKHEAYERAGCPDLDEWEAIWQFEQEFMSPLKEWEIFRDYVKEFEDGESAL